MDFQNLDAYWRAANYLTVGQIYLQDHPLLCGRDTLVLTGRLGERAAPVRWAALRFSSAR